MEKRERDERSWGREREVKGGGKERGERWRRKKGEKGG